MLHRPCLHDHLRPHRTSGNHASEPDHLWHRLQHADVRLRADRKQRSLRRIERRPQHRRPTVGSNPGDPDIAYQNTDVGNGGTGTFSDHTGWAPFSVAASFETADTSVDLSISKTAPPGLYGTGLPVNYTITVHNAGPA